MVKHGIDPALRFIGVAAVTASVVMIGGVVWLFLNGEPRGAWTMVVILVLGYAAMIGALTYSKKKG